MDRTGSVTVSTNALIASSGSVNFEDNNSSATWKKIMASFQMITVEPVLFFYMLATFMQYSVFQDLVYQKTCHFQFNETVCQNLNNDSNKAALDLVQEQASHWILGSTAALIIPSIIVANYLGSFSDLFDRKWPLLLPAVGMVLATIVYILMSLYEFIPVSLIILASFLSGIFGGFVSCIMAVMSYVAAVSSEESRSMRVALLEAMTFIGGTIGPFMGGAILQGTHSHSAVFLVILACYITVIVYVIFGVRSTRDEGHHSLSETHNCGHLFSCQHFQSSLQTCFKQRPGFKRRNLLILIVSALITMTVTAGEMDVAYLFTKDYPLAWSYETYSYYFGLKFGIGALCLIIISPLARRFGIHEVVLCCIGLISKAAGLAVHGFANTTILMFSVPFVSMLNTLCLPSIRSLLSKQVEPNELGKLFAFVASVENICTLLGSLIFNGIYPQTRIIFRGFIFEMASGLLLIPLIMMSYLGYYIKREMHYTAAESVRESVSSN